MSSTPRPVRLLRAAAGVTLAAAGVVLPACSGGEGGAGWGGAVVDSAGVALVSNPGEGVWTPETAWRVEEDLRIGALEGDESLQFGAITGIDVADDGTIFVVDQQAAEVRVFDRDGGFVRAMGGPGGGPGELGAAAAGLRLGNGDTLYVPDMANQRITRFLRDGSPAGTIPVPFRGGVPVRFDVGPDGRFLAQLRRMPIPGMEAPEGGADAGDPIVAYGADGAIADTVLVLPPGRQFRMGQGGMEITLFEPEPLWEMADDGTLFSAMNAAYRIEVRDPGGALRRVVSKDFERQEVGESDRTRITRALRRMMEEQGTPPQGIEMVMGNLDFADHYPAFSGLLAGPRGSLWVQRVRTAASFGDEADLDIDLQEMGSPEWEVFDGEGRFLGTVTLPDGFTPVVAEGREIHGIWEDELDVQHVMRLRVVDPAATG